MNTNAATNVGASTILGSADSMVSRKLGAGCWGATARTGGLTVLMVPPDSLGQSSREKRHQSAGLSPFCSVRDHDASASLNACYRLGVHAQRAAELSVSALG